ncbi:MAG: hypothetical protein LBT46_00160 [Planctomycetaceae bacterium]|jgi:hypothetical protein|nr:hypothetical protein [Planctomycetaceae bacterium]
MYSQQGTKALHESNGQSKKKIGVTKRTFCQMLDILHIAEQERHHSDPTS